MITLPLTLSSNIPSKFITLIYCELGNKTDVPISMSCLCNVHIFQLFYGSAMKDETKAVFMVRVYFTQHTSIPSRLKYVLFEYACKMLSFLFQAIKQYDINDTSRSSFLVNKT